MPSARETYAALVTDIIQQLEAGVMPWRRPWAVQRPTNLYTRKAYTGINVLALMNSATRRGYRSPSWITENQALDRGGRILPSEIDDPTFIAMMYTTKFTVLSKAGAPVVLRRLSGRSFPVYNLEQTRGLGRLEPAARNLDLWNQGCERIVEAWTGAPPIVYNQTGACYWPVEDKIGMPDLEQFHSSAAYYATLFHEMIHATGHPSRLNRGGVRPPYPDPHDSLYATEELIAELGSAFLCSDAGIGNASLQDNASYISSWLGALSENRTHFFFAAWQAERACEHVLGRVAPGKRMGNSKLVDDATPNTTAERRKLATVAPDAKEATTANPGHADRRAA